MATHEHPDRPKPTTYIVDDEPYTTTEDTLTPRAILANAGIDANTHYLALLHGQSGQKSSYENKLDEAIPMHPNMRFISISTGATTVSSGE